MTATLVDNFGCSRPALYLAFELGWSEWKLAFGTGPADAPRLRTLRARNLDGLHEEIAKAKKRFGLPEACPVLSCYEAGRDGFWLHRYLTAYSQITHPRSKTSDQRAFSSWSATVQYEHFGSARFSAAIQHEKRHQEMWTARHPAHAAWRW